MWRQKYSLDESNNADLKASHFVVCTMLNGDVPGGCWFMGTGGCAALEAASIDSLAYHIQAVVQHMPLQGIQLRDKSSGSS